MRRLMLAPVVALVLTASAQAATIQDLKSLGYTVKVVSQSLNCKEWAASGFGTSQRLGCEGTSGFQAAIDAMADPETACDVKWQYNHHDQRSAVSQLGQLGYVVTANECAGHYTVTNRYTKATVYSGNSAGLVALAAKLPAAAPHGTSVPALASTCLPMCTEVIATTIQTRSVSKTRVSLAVDISGADVELALEKRNRGSLDPLLSSAISGALGRKLLLSGETVCTIRGNPLDCSRLFNLISDTQVTVTFSGTRATEIGLPEPKIKANPPAGSSGSGQ
jgi:hypothetical protein